MDSRYWLSTSLSVVLAVGLTLARPEEVRGDTSNLVVHTAQGAVRGFVDGEQITFRNIPFAAPPVGSLRWRPTRPPKPWAGVRDGTQWGPMCPQYGIDGLPVGDEDCLNLNVHVPAAPSSGLPVMVYLTPGSNTSGDNRQDLSFLVSRGVIVVTPNYRLGVFGWMGHPLLTREGGGTSPNYGMYDQVAALRWVKKNIRAFGGDPKNVTLFGGSSGAFDAEGQLANPQANGLIAKVILESPIPFYRRLHDTEYAGAVVALNAGCGPTTDHVTACLRALSWMQLESAYEQFQYGPYNLAGLWYGVDSPTVDGITVVDFPLAYIEHHGSVPMLVGYDRDELSLFFDPLQPVAATQSELAALMYSNWGAWRWDPFNKAVYRSLQALYPLVGQTRPAPRTAPYQSINRAYFDVGSDSLYGFYSRSLARAAAQYGDQQASVYRYVFTHTVEVPADSPDYAFYQARGAFHLSQEVIYSNFLSFSSLYPAGYQPTPAELVLARQMADYWTNFAKSSDPNGYSVPRWPRYFEHSDRVQILDDPIQNSAKFHSLEQDLELKLYLRTPYATNFPWSVSPCTDVDACASALAWYLANIGAPPPDPYKAGW